MKEYRCHNCGSYLDPGERCSCREPVFRLITGQRVEQISKQEFLDVLQRMRGNSRPVHKKGIIDNGK